MKKLIFIVFSVLLLSCTVSFASGVQAIDSDAYLDHVTKMQIMRENMLRLLAKELPTAEDKAELEELRYKFEAEKQAWDNYLHNVANSSKNTANAYQKTPIQKKSCNTYQKRSHKRKNRKWKKNVCTCRKCGAKVKVCDCKDEKACQAMGYSKCKACGKMVKKLGARKWKQHGCKSYKYHSKKCKRHADCSCGGKGCKGHKCNDGKCIDNCCGKDDCNCACRRKGKRFHKHHKRQSCNSHKNVYRSNRKYSCKDYNCDDVKSNDNCYGKTGCKCKEKKCNDSCDSKNFNCKTADCTEKASRCGPWCECPKCLAKMKAK